MACAAAPVARAWADQALRLPGTTFLGICGDDGHNTRCSGHNAAPLCTDRGDFPAGLAHASDTGVPDDLTARMLLDAALHGPGQVLVLYAIHDGTGYYPDWRGGGTFKADGHEHHVHVSFNDRSTYKTPDFKITPDGPHPSEPHDEQERDPMAATRLIHVKDKPGPAAIVSWDGSGKTVQQLDTTSAWRALSRWESGGIPTLAVTKAEYDDIVGGKVRPAVAKA